jgi:glycosyltransferase involved in cell wall biosynthesis
LAEADILLHTAAWEGSPVAVEEAMLLGIPIVARTLPVLRDRSIQHLGSDAEELSKQVVLLAESANLRHAIGLEGRANALEFQRRYASGLGLAYAFVGGDDTCASA